MKRVNKVHLLCLLMCILIGIDAVQVQGSPVNEPHNEKGQVSVSPKLKSGKNLILHPAAFAYPYSIYPYSAYAYLYPSYVAQQVVPELSPLVPAVNANPPFPQHIATTGPCRDSKGIPGECLEFKKCYPYFKLPTVENYDTWIIGMFDTCSYYTEQGKQLFGVCCTAIPVPVTSKPTDPLEDTEVIDRFEGIPENINVTTETFEQTTEAVNMTYAAADRDSAKFDNIGNWPPPLPTHPPDHTIPPLPTHPPSHGIPGGIEMFPGGLPVLLPTTSWPAGFPPAFAPTVKPPFMKPIKPISTTKSTTTTTNSPSPLGIPACGAKNGPDQERIVGGHNAEVNEWPWIAALFNSGRQFCGGSLIDDIHILSAAHCVAHMSSWDVARLTVRLGDHNIKTNSETRHIEKKVKRVVRHKGFDSRTLYNDIALLTLDSPVEFTPKIRPVCLPTAGGRDWSGSTGTVIGWGSLRETGPQPSVLQEVNIPIWSNQQCKLKYGGAAPGGIVDHMICAGQANKDSCSGDSGGPLMVNHGKWTQVGVVSWGIGCGKGQYPGVYTRVEKFLPWIQKNLKR